VCTANIEGCTWTDIRDAIRDMESQEEAYNESVNVEPAF
jgi:hypothetical protein